MTEERTIGAIATAVVAGIALVLASGALIVSAGKPSAPAPETASAAVATDAPAAITVTLSEFEIAPSSIEIAPGGVITVSNAGSAPHDFAIIGTDLATPMLQTGDAHELELGELAPGTYEVHCSVPGHDSAGMTGTLVVAGAATATSATGEDDGGHAVGGHGADTDWAALDLAMDESIKRFPEATEGLGNQPLDFELLEDGTKRFELTAEIIDWEVEPGKVVEGWAYNGQIPGPLIKVDLGDKVEVIVHNKLPMGTDVHWHGVRVPNDQDGVAPLTQDLIEPNESFTYEFVADEPSIGMYHPHHHGQMKLPNGMFGAFLIGDVGTDIPLPYGRTISGKDIPEEIDIVQELPMILNDAGTIGLTLNGKGFPATEPIVVDEGDWIVVHYYNEGLQIHPMHLHQMPQLVFAKDGFALDAPQWEDTVNVAPGERYSVLIQATDPGVWAFHCHILTHAEREEGMFGMVTAMIVNAAS
jgi:manganese oxidase